MLIFDLIYNLFVLVALSVLSDLILRRFEYNSRVSTFLQGMLFGLIAIIGMHYPFVLEKGLIFDGRTIVLSLGTLFFGPLAGLIAVILAVIYRAVLAGPGLLMGLTTIGWAFLCGLCFRYLIFKIPSLPAGISLLTPFRLYLFQLVVHSGMVLLIFTLPKRVFLSVFYQVSPTIIIAYPLIGLLIGLIFKDMYERKIMLERIVFAEEFSRTTLYGIGDAIISFDQRGLIRQANLAALKLLNLSEKEALGKSYKEVFWFSTEKNGQEEADCIEKCLQTKEVRQLGAKIILNCPDGRRVPVAGNVAPIFNEKRELLGAVLVMRDQSSERAIREALQESEERYRQFFNLVAEGSWRFDLKVPVDINLSPEEQVKLFFEFAYLAECNESYLRMYGFSSKDDIVGKRLAEIMVPDDPTNIEYLKAFIQNGYRFNDGLSVEVDRFGNKKYFLNNLIGVIENGKFIRAWGTQRDITEQKRREEELLLLANALRSIREAVSITDAEDNILYINESFEKIYQYKLDEIRGKNITVLRSERNDPQYVAQILPATLKGGWEGELWNRRKDGSEILVYVSSRPVYDEQKNLIALIGVTVDITEKRRAEELLKESEAALRRLTDSTTMAIFVYDENNFHFVNQATEEITGFTQQELLQMTIWDMIHPDFREMVRQRARSRLRGDPVPRRYEFKLIRKDGCEVWVDFMGRTIEWKGRVMALGAAVDITERKLAEEALRREKEFLATTLRNIGDGVISLNACEQVVLMNREAEKLCGLSVEQVFNQHICQVFPLFIDKESQVNFESQVKRALQGEEIVELNDLAIINVDKKKFFINYSISPLGNQKGRIEGAVIVLRDVSEKRKLLETVQNAQKLESLGVLAGGIAHDFNNLLAGIFGFIEMARLRSKDQGLIDYLERAKMALDRARALTQQLLTFTKGGEPIRKLAFLEDFLRESVQFALSGSPVVAEFDFEAGLWACYYDQHQLGQVFDNLVINAVQAMPGGGKISIKVRNQLLKEQEVGTLPGGKYLQIIFQDHGTGMSPEVRSRIFEPFFTTKNGGHGLGLAISYSIVRRHQGEIVCESEPGQGTTFYIYLPAEEKTSSVTDTEMSFMHSGEGTILVMDDEDVVREVIREMLEYFGYDVLEAHDGEEALGLFKKLLAEKKELRAMIFDLTIPGRMGGKEAISQIRKLDQKVPVFVASGYSSDPILAHPEEYGFTASIKKPFQISELATVFNKYLNS